MRTSGVSLGKIPLFGRRRADIMINLSHCQAKNEAPFVSRMGHRAWSIGLNHFGLWIADCGFKNSKFKIRIFIWLRTIATCPLSPQETVPQFVIPAKSACGGREPGSTNNLIIWTFTGFRISSAEPGCFMNWSRETAKMGVPPGNRRVLVPRRT